MVRAPCCDKEGLKRGPWTPEEDKILIDYITTHGHGSWRSLPKLAGLLRCGKSCRLRWTNYLRPDIKRGPFTHQEQKSIIQLHAIVGNKWSTIAAHLPGRTDNEIKNYWNTHLKKRLLKLGVDPDAPYVSAAGNPVGVGLLHRHHHHQDHGLSPPSSATRHMAQWESARLEAEARMTRESMLFTAATSTSIFADDGPALHRTPSASPDRDHHHQDGGCDVHENDDDDDATPDFFLRIWNSDVGRSFRNPANTTNHAPAAAHYAGCSPAASSSTRCCQESSSILYPSAATVAPPLLDAQRRDPRATLAIATRLLNGTAHSTLGLKKQVHDLDDDDEPNPSSGSAAIADCSWTSSNDFVPTTCAAATDHDDVDDNNNDDHHDAYAAAAPAEESYQMYLDFATAAVDDMAGLFHAGAHIGGGPFSDMFTADLSDASLESAFN